MQNLSKLVHFSPSCSKYRRGDQTGTFFETSALDEQTVLLWPRPRCSLKRQTRAVPVVV